MKSTKHALENAENFKEEMMEEAQELKDNALEGAAKSNEKVSRMAEETASVTPTLVFAGAALLSIIVSLVLQIRGRRHLSLFVGHWAPTFLLFGLYNKFSKTVGAA
ncbi:MAG: hypothetical protein ABI036_18710 [Fibrobacteria bacterium]